MTASLATPVPARPTPIAIGASIGAFLAIGAANGLYGPVLPVLAARYALSPDVAGLLLTAHGLGAFVAVACLLHPIGRDRLRPAQPIAAALMAVGAATLAIQGPWVTMICGAFAVGAGFGLVTVGLNGLFARAFGSRSPAMVNLLNAVFGAGAMMAPAVLVATGGSVAIAFGGIALLCLLLILPASRIDDQHTIGDAGADAPRPVVGRVPFGPIALVFLCVALEASVIGWGPAVLVARGMGTLEAAGYASSFFAVFLLSRLAGIVLATRVLPRTLAIGALGGVAVTLLSAALTGAGAGFFAATGLCGLIFPNLFAWLSVGPLRHRRGGDAMLVTAAFAGATVGPFAAGLAADAIGTRHLFALLALFTVATLAMALLVRDRARS